MGSGLSYETPIDRIGHSKTIVKGLLSVVSVLSLLLACVHLAGVRSLGVETSYAALQVGFGVFAIASALLGWFIALKAPSKAVFHLVAISFAIMGVPLLEEGLTAIAQTRGNMAFLRVLASASGAISFYVVMAATLRFSQLFPEPLTALHIRAAMTERRIAKGITWLQTAVLKPFLVWSIAATMVILTVVGPLDLGPTNAPAITIVIAVLVLANLHASYVAADQPHRRRIIWLSLGLTIVTVMLLVAMAVSILLYATGWPVAFRYLPLWICLLGLAGGLCCVTFAVLYRGALDPTLLIERTLLYGLLAVILVFIFAGVENLVASFLAERLGLPSNIGGWVAGGTVALLLGPLNDTLSRRLRSIRRTKDPARASKVDQATSP